MWNLWCKLSWLSSLFCSLHVRDLLTPPFKTLIDPWHIAPKRIFQVLNRLAWLAILKSFRYFCWESIEEEKNQFQVLHSDKTKTLLEFTLPIKTYSWDVSKISCFRHFQSLLEVNHRVNAHLVCYIACVYVCMYVKQHQKAYKKHTM